MRLLEGSLFPCCEVLAHRLRGAFHTPEIDEFDPSERQRERGEKMPGAQGVGAMGYVVVARIFQV